LGIFIFCQKHPISKDFQLLVYLCAIEINGKFKIRDVDSLTLLISEAFTNVFYRKYNPGASVASSTATAPTPTKPDTSSLTKSTMTLASKPFTMKYGSNLSKKLTLIRKESQPFVPKNMSKADAPKNQDKGEQPKLSTTSHGFQPTLKMTNKTFVPNSLSKTVDPTQKPAEPADEQKVGLDFLFQLTWKGISRSSFVSSLYHF
jgi:hypothetical protein